MKTKTNFDTELFSVFEGDNRVAVLSNYKLESFMKDVQPQYHYGRVREVPCFRIYKLLKEENPLTGVRDGKWELIGEIDSRHLASGGYLYPPDAWQGEKALLLKEIEEEMTACIEKQRKIRNKELAKERVDRNAAEAAAKGMTVEDYMFSKKVARTEKCQDKNVEALRKQVAASFAYGKSLDKLEKELKSVRDIVETYQIERLNLRPNAVDFDYKVREMINSFKYFIRLHPPLDADPVKKPKSGSRRRRG